MREDDLRARVQFGFEAARAARERSDTTARLAALDDAHAAALALRDVSLLSTAAWRLAKARYDGGLNDQLIEPLAPLVSERWRARSLWGTREVVGPFDHYEQGLAALAPLSRRHHDHVGYGGDVLPALWDAWVAVRERREEPVLVAWGQVQRAWWMACTGRLDSLFELVHRYTVLPPSAFAHDRHRHARAPDPPGSLPWVQLDLARTLLHAATWAGVDKLAAEALDHLEDAAEDAELDRHGDFWFLDAILRASERFGWGSEPTYASAYAHLTAQGDVPEVHRLRGAALLARARGGGRDETVTAALACARVHAGPEWVVEAWREAGELDKARETAARFGVSGP